MKNYCTGLADRWREATNSILKHRAVSRISIIIRNTTEFNRLYLGRYTMGCSCKVTVFLSPHTSIFFRLIFDRLLVYEYASSGPPIPTPTRLLERLRDERRG